MESWKNLDTILTDDRKNREQKLADTQEMLGYVYENDKKEIKRMLLTGLSVNSFYGDKNALIVCMETDNLVLGLYFLKNSASPSYSPEPNVIENALWYALRNNKYDFLDMFILHNCNMTRAMPQKEIEEIVEETPPPPSKNGKGVPPPQEEIAPTLSYLVEGDTPLIYATKMSDVKAVELLLSHPKVRKKVNEIDREGRTALHHNLSKAEMTDADIRIGTMLLAAGIDTNIRDLEGKTAEQVSKSDASKTILLKKKVEDVIEDMPILEDTEANEITGGPRFKM